MKRSSILTIIPGDFDSFPEESPVAGASPSAPDLLQPLSDTETYPSALAEVLRLYRKELHMPDDAPAILTLSAVAASWIEGLAPVWLMLVAAPSSGKTSQIDPISRVRGVRVTGAITEAGLLSGSSKKDRVDGATGGLLREIGRRGVLAIRDFGSIISMHADKRGPLLAAFREIHDGSWVRNLGTDGGVSHKWEGHVCVVAACTNAVDKHHAVMQSLGDRFLYVRLRDLDPLQQARAAVRRRDQVGTPLPDLVAALIGALPTSGEAMEPDDEECEFIAQLARLAVRMRSAADRDSYSREVVVTPEAEAPARMAKALKAIHVGMRALGVPRVRRMQLLLRLAMDSMPEARRRIVVALVASDQALRLDALENASRVSAQTTRRHLEDLGTFGIITTEHGPANASLFTVQPEVRHQLDVLLRLAGVSKGVKSDSCWEFWKG